METTDHQIKYHELYALQKFNKKGKSKNPQRVASVAVVLDKSDADCKKQVICS